MKIGLYFTSVIISLIHTFYSFCGMCSTVFIFWMSSSNQLLNQFISILILFLLVFYNLIVWKSDFFGQYTVNTFRLLILIFCVLNLFYWLWLLYLIGFSLFYVILISFHMIYLFLVLKVKTPNMRVH